MRFAGEFAYLRSIVPLEWPPDSHTARLRILWPSLDRPSSPRRIRTRRVAAQAL